MATLLPTALQVNTNVITHEYAPFLPFSRKMWWGIKFGGLADHQPIYRQIKFRQIFFLACIHITIMYRAAKLNVYISELYIWDQTAKYGSLSSPFVFAIYRRC